MLRSAQSYNRQRGFLAATLTFACTKAFQHRHGKLVVAQEEDIIRGSRWRLHTCEVPPGGIFIFRYRSLVRCRNVSLSRPLRDGCRRARLFPFSLLSAAWLPLSCVLRAACPPHCNVSLTPSRHCRREPPRRHCQSPRLGMCPRQHRLEAWPSLCRRSGCRIRIRIRAHVPSRQQGMRPPCEIGGRSPSAGAGGESGGVRGRGAATRTASRRARTYPAQSPSRAPPLTFAFAFRPNGTYPHWRGRGRGRPRRPRHPHRCSLKPPHTRAGPPRPHAEAEMEGGGHRGGEVKGLSATTQAATRADVSVACGGPRLRCSFRGLG